MIKLYENYQRFMEQVHKLMRHKRLAHLNNAYKGRFLGILKMIHN